jgi:hypothetical protein
MASEKQIEANRRNAQLSTGPVTPEGKAAVARNALKHGLRADCVLFVHDEDAMQALRDEIADEWQPQTFTEWTLVEQMAVAIQKRACYEELEAHREDQLVDGQFRGNLQIIWRRQASIDRAYFKALETLLKLRKARAQAKAAQPDPQPKVAAKPAPTPIPRPEPPSAPEPSQPCLPDVVMLDLPPDSPPDPGLPAQ